MAPRSLVPLRPGGMVDHTEVTDAAWMAWGFKGPLHLFLKANYLFLYNFLCKRAFIRLMKCMEAPAKVIYHINVKFALLKYRKFCLNTDQKHGNIKMFNLFRLS